MDRFPRIFERGSGNAPASDANIGDPFRPWGNLIRALAGMDPTRYVAVARCSLETALYAYQESLKRDARHEHEVATLVWAVLLVGGCTTKEKMPELPAILKD